MTTRPSREAGMVTAFVAGITAALLLAAGLVIDGGGIVAARREAIGEASAAARAGAQALNTDKLRSSGAHELDRSAARAAARTFLAQDGRDGDVGVNGSAVTVTVRIRHPMFVLGIAGLRATTVTGRATARAVHGITTEEP